MTDVPEPEVGHNDLLLIKTVNSHLVVLTFTSITGMTIANHPGSDGRGHEYVGEVVGIGQK